MRLRRGPSVCSGLTASVAALFAMTTINLLVWVSTESFFVSRSMDSSKPLRSRRAAKRAETSSLFLISFLKRATRPTPGTKHHDVCSGQGIQVITMNRDSVVIPSSECLGQGYQLRLLGWCSLGAENRPHYLRESHHTHSCIPDPILHTVPSLVE